MCFKISETNVYKSETIIFNFAKREETPFMIWKNNLMFYESDAKDNWNI